MERTYIIREWLRRELGSCRRAVPWEPETEYESMLRELLAVVDKHTTGYGL